MFDTAESSSSPTPSEGRTSVLSAAERRPHQSGGNMKKASVKKRAENGMRAQYDFRGGLRGKHYKAYGSSVVQHFKLEDGAVLLDPDVREYFPTSEAVNTALRSLISLIPKKRKAPGTR